MLVNIILATSAVSLISLIGVLLVFKGNKPIINIKSIISFAAGSLLGVTFLELLPELFEDSVFEPRQLFLMVLVSIIFFFILERFMHWHHCLCRAGHDHDHSVIQNSKKKTLVLNNLIGDGIHNIIDGFLIAAAFMVSKEAGLAVTLAVIIHEIPQEISDFGVLLYGGLSKSRALVYNLLIGLTAVLGAVLFFFFLHDYQWITPLFVAFAAGNFIYLAMADIIPHLHEEKDTSKFLKHTVWFLVGILVMWFALGGIEGHSHSAEAGHEEGVHIEEIHEDDHDE